MDFDRLTALAFSLMGKRKSHLERETGFTYDHGVRVSNLALALRRRLYPEDASFDDVLRCAALFHDLGKGIGEHGHTGALLARDVLRELLTPDELETVCGLIDAHNKRRPGGEGYSPAALLLQDADLLDHYGSCEVWLNVSYCCCKGTHFHDSVDFYRDSWPAQVAQHRALLHYDLSKAIFDDKVAFVNLYAARVAQEGRGEIFESSKII